ncbi:MAG: GNAT family N-acetyltransferase [Rhodospirillales bacterium]|nr:GNAT family N-acetyltransferase [Rhodospirillales bacterium]MDH3793091.1 GNAT family N-acetyltransferase [Rhodospirillales bacterium]MDH3913793.1 GNAT family N-acetyltransferase [Rhodospirillales bacterium]MDH3967039.1 GNAT family N-acetyltransferase [Rhodospirillales bacterium]
MSNQIRIESLAADSIDKNLEELAAVLNACVHDGASVSFILPHAMIDSMSFWSDKVRPAVRAGTRLLLVARLGGRIAGSVQLDHDTPPNQAHRAEVSKLLVHPHFRGRGVAKALMTELEKRANELGRSLITLDTRTGDRAESLYRSLGYETAGIIPAYARNPFEDRLDPTTFMYKML